MKLGCQMAFNERTSPDFVAAAGALVEECGIHSLWVPEHVLFFPEYASRYPYTDDGKIAGDPNAIRFIPRNKSRAWITCLTAGSISVSASAG
jgi:hypothetical protein